MSACQDRVAVVALLRLAPGGLSWAQLSAELLASRSAQAVWDRRVPPALVPAPRAGDPLEAAAAELSEWARRGFTLTTILDPQYPGRLREISQAPPVLFSRGTLAPDDLAVSVVGSRAASPRGLVMAAEVARELAARRLTVVAGLARGIDTAAHSAALAVGGRTVAVIATGISRVYPPENAELHEQIAARGLLLSQFWPDAPPEKHAFLLRNATMSGYSLATVIVEAQERSGARAGARLAIEQGRPVILTDLVVDHNEWARALVGRPEVHVARGAGAVGPVIDQLLKARPDLPAQLARPAPA